MLDVSARALASLVQVPYLARTPALSDTGLFDGLVHVRFSFDRLALQRMHAALALAADRQLVPHAIWLPSGEPMSDSGREGGSGGVAESCAGAGAAVSAGPALSQAERWRLEQLQPEAGAVAVEAGAMRERGSQRPLNAEQRHAIASVVCGAGRAMPYALFGPPGAPFAPAPGKLHCAACMSSRRISMPMPACGWRATCIVPNLPLRRVPAPSRLPAHLQGPARR